MRRRWLPALLCAVLLLGMLVFSASAVDDVYFLSLNDSLKPLTGEYMPIRVNHVVYIPCTVFDQRLTGVNLGVYYGQDKSRGIVTLYSREKNLIFDISAGSASDNNGNVYFYRATTRDGRTYLPAYTVCQHFGLSYSFLSTKHGPMIRIKTGAESLDDRFFVNSASYLMAIYLNDYQQSQAGTADPSPSPSSPPGGGSTGNVQVYLSFRVDSGLRLEEMLDTLDAHGIRALFFFPPDALAGHDDTIRRMIGSGHQVGFLVSGAPADALAQLDRGNGLLEHIARQRTCTVLADGDDALRGALEEAGWLCWTWNVDGRTGGRSASSLTGVISDRVGAKLYFARVLMDDTGTAPTALPAILRGLRDVGYDLRLAVETTLS